MATTRRQAAHDSGEDIWDRVAEAGDVGLPREEAMGRNTPAQFERGKAWIRDHQCANKKTGFVLVHSHYAATNNVDMNKLYASIRLHSLYKSVERVYKCALANLPADAKSDLSIMVLLKTCDDIFAAMKFLEEAGFSAQAAGEAAQGSSEASTASAKGRKTSGSAGRR
ncbi:hypothetical protein [Kitasatospora viridis]|uniref:Uncharacterized protein n=1 Tax=Kitasatospora viridis TaxID=281105 RepID=A0A561UIA8_9ACTN|nr:hypothetical protein [Kitasatospora viridis]TWF99086.1 hypothetical protein FHX73_112922 [Kitasatospora viridis]